MNTRASREIDSEATTNVYAEEDGAGLRDGDGKAGGRAGREGGAKDANGGGGGAERPAGGNDEGVLQSTKTRMIAAAGTLPIGTLLPTSTGLALHLFIMFFNFSPAPQSFRQIARTASPERLARVPTVTSRLKPA